MTPRFKSALASVTGRLRTFGTAVSARLPAERSEWIARGRPLAGELAAGFVASLLTLTNCLSFAALIFAGPLKDGLPFGLWSFMIGAAGGCIVTSLVCSLPPAMAGPRNPPLAVASVVAAGLGAQVLASGGSSETAVAHVLMTLAIATLAAGLAMWLIGRLRLGASLRFVPFPVIGGFLAASGWFLIVGGFNVALGRPLGVGDVAAGLSTTDLARIGVAIGFVVFVVALRRLRSSAAMLPLAFFAAALLLEAVLSFTGAREGWFPSQAQGTAPWSPLSSVMMSQIDWPLLASAAVEIASVVGVAVVALLLDVSTLEVQRGRVAVMDDEFRRAGAVNIGLVAAGGALVGLAPNASRLLDQLGARGRLSGVAAGVVIGLIALSGFDVTRLIPTPVLGGLLLYLGLGVIGDALLPAPGQSSKSELLLAVLIAVAIVRFGYLSGIMLGLIGATLTFAICYSRVGAIRRHATRSILAPHVERAPTVAALLSREGGRIHVFWLSGYIFFGTSNRVFEEIRDLVSTGRLGVRRWVVLDMSGVTGFDGSAMYSFRKLATWASANGVGIFYAALSADSERRMSAAGLLMGRDGKSRQFANRAHAIEQAELELIADAGVEIATDVDQQFGNWLQRELGREPATRLIERYLTRRTLEPGATICSQGEVADTIDFVVSGSIVVLLIDQAGAEVPLRRMTGCTVIGEMGFIRSGDRTASVVADNEATILTLTRARYLGLRRDDPELATALLEFFVRQLADRLEFANMEVAALS